MPQIDPTFFAVISTHGRHGVVSISGRPDKSSAEGHARQMLVGGQAFVSIHDSGAEAASAAEEANRVAGPGGSIDAAMPANVADLLDPPAKA